MSDRIKFFFYGLWILHPILQIGIGAFMLRRGLVRQFKFFFGYILTQLAIFAVVFPAYCLRSFSAAFYLYWACNAISVAFGFATSVAAMVMVMLPPSLRQFIVRLRMARRWAGCPPHSL